jgi:hypothetical protein
MQKAFAVLQLLGLCLFFGHGVFLYAQEEDWEDDPGYDEGIPFESDWEDYRPDLYTRGDQTFTISAGVFFPPVFFDYEGKRIDHPNFTPVGGTGFLAYTYFLGPYFFLGGEAGVKISSTLAANMIYIGDIGVRTGFQFVLRRFEFPLTLVVGVAPQRYLNLGYAGLFVKGGVSVYYRFNPDWSFGVNSDWTWYPQWPKEDGIPAPTRNVDANMIGVTLSARYHF